LKASKVCDALLDEQHEWLSEAGAALKV